jgi:hypothetical protein
VHRTGEPVFRAPHPSHTYASPGTYTVYLTVTDASAPAPEMGGGILVLAIAATGAVIVGGGAVVAIRRWWMHRRNPALFRKYD